MCGINFTITSHVQYLFYFCQVTVCVELFWHLRMIDLSSGASTNSKRHCEVLIPSVPKQSDLLAYRQVSIYSKMENSGHTAVMGHKRGLGTAQDSRGTDSNPGFSISIPLMCPHHYLYMIKQNIPEELINLFCINYLVCLFGY